MDPATMALFFGGLGSSALANLFAPDEQEIFSFADEGINPNLHPATVLQDVLAMLGRVQAYLGDRVDTGANLVGATAQNPPIFAGGGLPFAIGLSGVDPAIEDDALLYTNTSGRSRRKRVLDEEGIPLYTPGEYSNNVPIRTRTRAVPDFALPGGYQTPSGPGTNNNVIPDADEVFTDKPQGPPGPRNPNPRTFEDPDRVVGSGTGDLEFDQANAGIQLLLDAMRPVPAQASPRSARRRSPIPA